MEREKNMFSFAPENRIIDNQTIAMPIKLAHGWDKLYFTHKVITGWKMPEIKEDNDVHVNSKEKL